MAKTWKFAFDGCAAVPLKGNAITAVGYVPPDLPQMVPFIDVPLIVSRYEFELSSCPSSAAKAGRRVPGVLSGPDGTVRTGRAYIVRSSGNERGDTYRVRFQDAVSV